MEASENTVMSPGGGGAALHRIDPARVTETLSSGANSVGFARLNLMINTVFDRLVAEPSQNR